MATVRRIKQITLSLGIIGFIPALFLYGQTIGMGMRTDALKEIGKMFSDNGSITLDDLALRYSLIALSFLLFILLLLIAEKFILKVAGLIPLAYVLMQFGFLITLKNNLFYYPDWGYSNWLGIAYYIDLGLLALTVLLLILQLYSVWHVYRSASKAIQKSPMDRPVTLDTEPGAG